MAAHFTGANRIDRINSFDSTVDKWFDQDLRPFILGLEMTLDNQYDMSMAIRPEQSLRPHRDPRMSIMKDESGLIDIPIDID